MDSKVIDWVTMHFLPFEAELRSRLRRVCSGPGDIDDVIQETYAKVLGLSSMAHVRDPKGFLIRIAKNIVTDRLRRDAIVSIEAVANLEDLDLEHSAPSPERIVEARVELHWVFGLIARLPERCKEVFKARRVYGLSQNETAAALGISEGMVEQETIKGMDLISDMIANEGFNEGPRQSGTQKPRRSRGKNNVIH